MEIRNNIKLSLDQGAAVEADLAPDLSSASLARILRVPRAHLLRRSVDARKRIAWHKCNIIVGHAHAIPVAVAVEHLQRHSHDALCSHLGRMFAGSAQRSHRQFHQCPRLFRHIFKHNQIVVKLHSCIVRSIFYGCVQKIAVHLAIERNNAVLHGGVHVPYRCSAIGRNLFLQSGEQFAHVLCTHYVD